MRAANCAMTSATSNWPASAISQVQIPTGPELFRNIPYVPKMPTATEMNAKDTANTWNEPSVR